MAAEPLDATGVTTTPPGAVAELAARLIGMGCYEVSLGDTIGRATPETLAPMLAAVTGVVP
ncbi:MAG: hypothetical protein ACK4M5_16750, partial [Dietzia cercidiphylli]